MRHTRATELANILTEAQMKEHLDWVPGSDIPSTYVHLSGRDVDGAMLKAHGIAVDKELKVKVALALTKCPRRSRLSSQDHQCLGFQRNYTVMTELWYNSEKRFYNS
jgi:hypothetical protein